MFIEFEGKQIYTEVHGAGEPLVILNGIMMSTLSWAPLVPALAKHNQVILFDMLDQGQSSKMTEGYHICLQAEVLKRVLDELGHQKAHLVSASYGAAVAMHFALKYPERVDKLILANCASYASEWLKQLGAGWMAARNAPEAMYHSAMSVIYSIEFFNKNQAWMDSRRAFLLTHAFRNDEFIDALGRLMHSFTQHDVRDRLGEIRARTMLIGSRDDLMTPVYEQRYIYDRLPNASFFAVIEDCGHASPYEKPDSFLSLVSGFLNTDTVIIA